MKKNVFFGTGTVAEQNLRLNPEFIVDNNKDHHGDSFHGIPVHSPDILKGCASQYHVIICTTSIDQVAPQLEGYGYVPDVDFSIAEQLTDRLAVDRLEKLEKSFLISSGLPSHIDDISGGGVFHIKSGSDKVTVEKLYSGNVHGLIKSGDNYLFNAQGDGIYVLSNLNEEPVKLFGVPAGFRPHGIRVYGDKFLMVSSFTDSVILVNGQGEIEREFQISEKAKTYGSAQHHCNDICLVGKFAYISMFSVTGNWKRGKYDGGIVELDLETGEMMVLDNTLTMPHNISVFDGQFRVLNSFKGEILLNNFELFGSLPGFVRGLDEDSHYLYVGESKNRNFNRLNTSRTPVSIDTRITIIDKKYKCSKSLPLPRSISEVHSLLCVS